MPAEPGGRSADADGSGPLLTKCCLLEDRVASDGDAVVVPWGASLTQIRDGLRLAVAARSRPMTDRIADSALYRHLWGTDEARAVLGEDERLGLAGSR